MIYKGIRKQKKCKGFYYRIHFKLPSGKEISIEKGSYDTQEQAYMARKEKIIELTTQDCLDVNKTFGEIFYEYLDTLEDRYALRLKYTACYNTRIKEDLENVLVGETIEPLQKLQKKLCNSMITDGRSGKKIQISKTYLQGIKALLQNVYDYAYVNRYISQHPIYHLDDWIIQVKEKNEYIEPLFAYLGNKHKLLPDIIKLFPDNIGTFVDAFAGSAVVGVNVNADTVIINETNAFLLGIYKGLHTIQPDKAWNLVISIADKYKLSKENAEGYYKCRADYNLIPYNERVNKYWYWGLCLVYHSFNRSTVQENSMKEYNAPFGSFKVNMALAESKFKRFAEKLYQGKFVFSNCDYKEKEQKESTFIYIDPPYLITTATYNKSWNLEKEQELYRYLEELNDKGIRWAFSNVFRNNGKDNVVLREWVKKMQENHKNIHLYYLNAEYSHANFRRKNKGKTVEILLTNY